MNERDSEAVAALLRNKGYSIVQDEGIADVILLNTCSVREQAEKSNCTGGCCRSQAKAPKLVLGIMGYVAQNRGDALIDSLPDLDLIIGTQKFHRVPDHLDNVIASLNGLGPKPSTLVDIDAEAGSQNTIKSHLILKKNHKSPLSLALCRAVT